MKLHLPLLLRCFVLLSVSAVPAVADAVGSTWDPAWGAAGLEGAPDAAAPQYQATISTDGVTALVPPAEQAAPWDFGSYTAITLTGSGNAGAIIIGGASATQSPLVGAVERNSWIAAESGSYDLLVGGSYADNWQSGPAFNFTGDSHIMVAGASVANIIGGSYKDGRAAGFTGDSYITVASGNVSGCIVGATVVTHDTNSSFTGDTHIFVYTPLTDNSGPRLHLLPADAIIGGFGWGTNTRKTQTLDGSTHVTVDLSGYTGSPVAFSKHIVGGGFNGTSTNTHVITGDTYVSVNLGTCSTAEGVRVMGGAWDNAGSSRIEGSSHLNILGGEFRGWVLGGTWTDTGSTVSVHGDIELTLTGGSFYGNVLGATYITTGNCSMSTGDVNISLGGGAELQGTLYGGYYVNGDGSATVDASVGDISLTLAGASVGSIIGGSYTQRNKADNTITQGNISLLLQSGSVSGNIYAAGQQDGSTPIQTASTTVQLSAAVQLAPGITLSGAYAGSGGSSVVSGERRLVLADASAYAATAGVNVADFDVVQVAAGGSATLASLVSDRGSMRKTGAGSLTASANGAFDTLSVEGGSLALLGGVEGAQLQSLSIASGSSLAGVRGTVSAGAAGETVLSLELSTGNIGAGTAATPMISGVGGEAANLTLSGAENVAIDISADGVVELLLAHKDATPAVSSYLTLVDGTLTCVQPAQLPLSELLAGYGLRIAGVTAGSLVVNGSAAGIYYVTADAATTDPHLVTTYPPLGLYSGVVIEGGQELTLSLPGDTDATTMAVVNNLMGATGSSLRIENGTGSGIATVVLDNHPISSTGDATYPDIPSRTLMAGDITAGSGTELLKRGAGELEVGGNLQAPALAVDAGVLSLRGSANRLGELSGAAGTLQLAGNLLVQDSLAGSVALSVASGASLYLDNVASIGNAGSLSNRGSAVADITTTRSLTLGTLSLGADSQSELRFNTDADFSASLLLQGLTVEPGAAVTLQTTGDTLLRSGEYVLGRVADTATLQASGAVQLTLSGFPATQLQPGASYLYTDAAGNILLHTERRSSNPLLPYADSHNAAAGASLLWDSDPTPGGDLAAAYRSINELIASGSEAETGRALAAVAGSAFSSLTPALHGDTERRLRRIREHAQAAGVNPCVVNNGLPYLHFRVQAEADYSNLSGSHHAPGYDFSRWGATLGMTADMSDSFSAGLALTSLWGDLRTDAPDRLDSDVNTTYFSFFARYRSCCWVHILAGTFGLADFDSERRVRTGSAGYNTHSSTDGRSLGLMYELVYDRLPHADDALFLQPLINISFRHSSVGSFTEHGSDASLRVSPADMNTLTLAVGARMQAVVGENWYNRSSLFQCRALLAFDIGDRRGEASTALLQGSGRESVQGSSPGAFGAELGAGLSIPIGAESGTIFMDAAVLLRSHLSEVNGTVGYSISF